MFFISASKGFAALLISFLSFDVSQRICVSLIVVTATRQRPTSSIHFDDKENIPTPPHLPNTQKPSARLYGGTLKCVDRLIRPFSCPGSATPTRASEKPARKRRKVSYANVDGDNDDGGDKAYTNTDRLALSTRDVNRFPVFKVKNKDIMFRARFAVPLKNKNTGGYNAARPAPLLGMRQGAVFVAKALHDPSGEFAIVLFDPTVDGKAAVFDGGKEEEGKVKVDVPIMHKSLADILGLKKQVGNDRPQVPVVIDPRLAKVLRPHQVEGVRVGW